VNTHLRPLCRCLWILAAIAAGACAALARAGVVVCPAETPAATDAWAAITAEAAAGRAGAAVERLDQLLAAGGGAGLSVTADGGLVSLNQSVSTLPTDVRAALASAAEERFGAAAREALVRVRERPDHAPADLLAVADRLPLCQAATDARRLAAARALAQGDADGAAALAGQSPPATPFAAEPFDARWFGKLNELGAPRRVPVGSATVTYLADRERGVLAFAADGRVLWRYVPPPATAAAATGRSGDTGRGALSVPAVLADAAGQPQLVLARLGIGLTALRASDGRLFWATDGDPAWAGVMMLSSPTVAGRCVAAVAVVDDALAVVAADVTDGRPLWRCKLGPVSDPLDVTLGRSRRGEPEFFRDASPPTITGNLIVVPDDAGAVVAIDRFAGDVRWVRPYAPAPTGGLVGRRFNDGVNRGLGMLPPLPTAALLRWSGGAVVAGDVVWVAPQDAAITMGLDRRTGRVLWQTSDLPEDATCVGVAAGRFILGGRNVTAIDPATGTAAWTVGPSQGVWLTGPPAVRDGHILVRSTAGLLEATADGNLRPAASDAVDFHAVVVSEPGRSALTETGMSAEFAP
jgi:outer membrane protein assembly factor BamB